MRRSSFFCSVCQSKGFTLVELLVVISIIAIISAIAAPNMSASIRGSRVSQTAYALANEVERARTIAMASHTPVILATYKGDQTNWNVGTGNAVAGITFTPSDQAMLNSTKPTWLTARLSSYTAGSSGSAALTSTKNINSLISVVPVIDNRIPSLIFWPDGRVTRVDSNNTLLAKVAFTVCARDLASDSYEVAIRLSGTVIVQKTGRVEIC